MAISIGIDFGNTYSTIATLDANGELSIIENYDDGGRSLASAVYFPCDGAPLV